MPYLKKTNPGVSTTVLVSADQWNDFVGRVTGEVLADTSFEWNLANPTRFKTNALRLWHAGGTDFAYRFVTSTLTASRDIIVPTLPGNDTLCFLALAQTLTNKVINATDNTITDTGAATGDLLYFNGTRYVKFLKGAALQLLRTNSAGTSIEWVNPPSPVPPGGFSRGGVATFSGNASTKIFNIPHTLTLGTPDIAYAQPYGAFPDTLGDYTVNWDGTNVIVTYQVAPPTGSSNIKLVWGAGYIDEADLSSFTPTTSNVLQNKTISGTTNTFSNIPLSALTAFNVTSPLDNQALTYDTASGKWINETIAISNNPATYGEIATPANQTNTDDILLYNKQIDTNNNALFAKYKEANAIVEVRIF